MITPLAYVIDTLALDMYVNSSSHPDQRLPMKKRPWLILCIEPVSRRVLASYFSEQHPGPESLKAILYKAFFPDDEAKWSAVLPDEIGFDAGIDAFPSSIKHLMQSLNITFRATSPSEKGGIERFFARVQHVFAQIPTNEYSASLGHVITEATLPEIEEHFIQFLQHYHHQSHPSTGLAPLESWQKHCHPSPVDPRLLDPLLHDGGQRRVLKDGIHYQNNIYWHSDLAHYVGKEIHIRMKPTQPFPEMIEVFFEQQWICSASLQEEANENPFPNENGEM